MAKNITCPYCYNKFDSKDALAQCNSNLKNSDGEYQCERETNPDFDKFWKGEDLPIRHTWKAKTSFFGGIKRDQKCDQCGFISNRFVCPHCYNWLPVDMIEEGAEVISVIGSPSSGKTNYIVALIHELRKYGYKLDLTIIPTQEHRDDHPDEKTQAIYKRMDDMLFREHDVIGKTSAEVPYDIPWIFKLSQQSTNQSIYLVFYDTAGERCVENLSQSLQHMRNCAGVIVILDPLSIPAIEKVLDAEGASKEMGKPANHMDEITTALGNYKDDPTVYDKPFAFVFSKFDVVIDHKDSLNFNADIFRVGDTYKDSVYKKTGLVDMSDIDEASAVIEETLSSEDAWDEGATRLFAHNWASKKNRSIADMNRRNPNDPDNNYKFFGVSALGGMPSDDRIDEVKPFRVMDPLIWILHKIGKFKIPTVK